jgi:hypothetical protein
MSALNLAQVLWDERQALAGRPLHFPPASDPATGASPCSPQEPEPKPEKISEIYRKLNADNRWALCLSGGGIRSAAFALGILQRFGAQQISSKRRGEQAEPALHQFEYLSTVSGGGYIGCWLSTWLFEERTKRATATGRTGGAKGLDANEVVVALNQRLTDVADGDGRIRDHEEFESISNLRRDSHYLAPSLSAISPDLWSDIAGVVRNLCLNWILLVPPMFLSVLVTKALAYAFIEAGNVTHQSVWFVCVMVAAAICFMVSLSFSAANRPARGLINAGQPLFLICDLAIFLIGAALLVFVLGSPNGQETLSAVIRGFGLLLPDDLERHSPAGAVLFRGALLGLAIHFASWWLAPGAWC